MFCGEREETQRACQTPRVFGSSWRLRLCEPGARSGHPESRRQRTLERCPPCESSHFLASSAPPPSSWPGNPGRRGPSPGIDVAVNHTTPGRPSVWLSSAVVPVSRFGQRYFKCEKQKNEMSSQTLSKGSQHFFERFTEIKQRDLYRTRFSLSSRPRGIQLGD